MEWQCLNFQEKNEMLFRHRSLYLKGSDELLYFFFVGSQFISLSSLVAIGHLELNFKQKQIHLL